MRGKGSNPTLTASLIVAESVPEHARIAQRFRGHALSRNKKKPAAS
jgi:hypothetical protein